ncbi:MAG: ubiquinone anaerobic biosynthesis protein UbiU [Acidiferrobacterales bacterium]
MNGRLELVCPAGSLPALRVAVDHGADAVYLGLRNATNARNFSGLNFDDGEMRRGIQYAHEGGARVFLALNTYARAGQWGDWTRAADLAADLGADAVILADPGLMRYCRERHPELRLHLSVQGSATNPEAIRFYARQFGVQRVVLPRVLSLSQVRYVISNAPVEVEVFGFGSLCVMVEGRCALSSYVTGESPNTCGVCSPAKAVRWEETGNSRRSRLNGVLIDVYAPGESAGYPTLCKGRFIIRGGPDSSPAYALEEPTSLNVLGILPELMHSGIAAIKVEGRQRSPAYVGQVTRVLRAALDACMRDPSGYAPRPEWVAELDRLAEGRQHTLGAIDRAWQ